MRDIVRRTVKVIRAKPKAKFKEAEHLVSYQNRQWLYNLFMNSWSASMTSTMDKFLESYNGDVAALLYCFMLHFTGASTENIIQVNQQLTETKIQLSIYKNDVSAFTNAVHVPTCQLANFNQQATFQHHLNVYHAIIECPNEEFRSYATILYQEYHSGGRASKWTMFELLDELDKEYVRIKSLNLWEIGGQGSEILALTAHFTAQISELKKIFSKIQKT